MAAEQLQQLIQLQEKDRKRVQLQKELRQIPDKRKAIEARRAAAAKDLENSQAGLKQCQLQMKEHELDIEGLKSQVRRYKTQQMEVRDQESYRALEGEIAEGQKKIDIKEDMVLMLMEQVEKIKATIGEREATLAKVKADTDAELKVFSDREAKLNADVAQLESDRQAFIGGIDDLWLTRYEAILKNKGDFALVGVDGSGICQGCHMKVTPSTVVSAKNLAQITTCNYCGRMLYFRIA